MQSDELKKILKTTGISIAYSHFKSTPKPPFITFIRESDNVVYADDKVYSKRKTFSVELFTSEKDTDSEAKLENVFEENEICFKLETVLYIESENLYETIYTIEV